MVLDVIIIFTLFIEVLFISYIEKKVHGTLLTPINILAIPYLFLIIIIYLFAEKLGFVKLYTPSIIFWIIGLILFWIPSLILNYHLHSKKIFLSEPDLVTKDDEVRSGFTKLLLIISWISILIVAGGFVKAINKFGIQNLGSEEFTTYYGSGISGHFIVLNILLFIYFIGIAKRGNHFILITIITFLITFVLYQVKTWVFIPFLSGILYRYYRGNFRTKVKNALLVILSSVVFFFATYYFSIGLQTKFLLNHIVSYAFSGILGFSEYCRENVPMIYDSTFLIRPIENIYNQILNIPLNNVVQKTMVNISNQNDITNLTNVRTFFGTIRINSSIFVSIIYIFLISLLIHIVYISSILKKNKWIILLSSFILAELLMGWFVFSLGS